MSAVEGSAVELPVPGRRCEVRRLLVERRREVLSEIQSRVRDVREVGASHHHYVTDLRDAVEADPEDDVVFALLQLKSETLARIDEAMRHVDEGTYGACADCGRTIGVSRLRALPFAVRCRTCEEAREEDSRRNVSGGGRSSMTPGTWIAMR